MTIEEFGASIKAKYPEYAKFEDAVIGQKMLEKYPEYANRVTSKVNVPSGLPGETEDNRITNELVKQGKLPPERSEIYPNPEYPTSRMTKEEALAKQVPLMQEEQLNPVVQALGMLQEKLGTTDILPTAYGLLGKAIAPQIPVIPSAVGASVGTRLKQMSAKGGVESLIPTKNELVDTGKNAAIAGVLDLLSTGVLKGTKEAINFGKGAVGAKSLSPIKIASYLRSQAADKAGNITTKSLIEAGEKYVSDNPLAKEVWDVFKPTIKENMPAKQLLDKMSSTFGLAYTRSGAVRDTAQAELMNKLYQAGKLVLKEQAPEVAKYTSGMRQILSAPQQAQRLTWLALKLAGIGRLIGL